MSDRSVGVPFLDLAEQHAEIRPELEHLWRRAIETSSFVGGHNVDQFESAFAEYCGVDHCVGVGNGTDALQLIFAGLGLRHGDEVIVPANTFAATVSAIVAVGAIPIFVDVDSDTLLITAALIEAAITPATAAVAVVHLYGQVADMGAIARVADRAGLAVVEDAAQAHGAEWAGRKAGSFGRAAAFSFYPGKNLGALGDGGAVVTNDGDLARRVRSLADHGRSATSRHVHEICGVNSRLDALQAAVLAIKLTRLDDWNGRRREAAARYRKLLDGLSCMLQTVDPNSTPVHHLEVVRVADRDAVLAEFDRRRIGWGIHYRIPAHRQPAFDHLGTGALPVTEHAADEILSLPMYPTIRDKELEMVCDALRTVVEGGRA